MKNIELITCESGDWSVLKKDGIVYYEGHEIPTDVWLKIIEETGVSTNTKEISDEDMEGRNY